MPSKLVADDLAATDAAKKAERAKRFGLVPALTGTELGADEALEMRAKRFGLITAAAPANGGSDSKPLSQTSVASREKGKGKRKDKGKAEEPARIDAPLQDSKGKSKGKGAGKVLQKPRENNVQDYTDHVVRLAGHDGKLQNRLRGWVRDKIMGLQAAGSLKSINWEVESLPTSDELKKMGWVEPVVQAANGSAHSSTKGEHKAGRSTPYGATEHGRSSASSCKGPSTPSSFAAPPHWHYPPPVYGHPPYGYPPFYGVPPPPVYHPPPPPHGTPVYPDYQRAPPAAAQPALPAPGKPSPPVDVSQQAPPGRHHGVRLRSRSPLGRPAPPPPTDGFRVRLINVPPELTAIDFVEALQDICKQRIESVDILRNTETGKATGEALVVFNSREDACTVVTRYHKGDLNGRLLEVVLEEPTAVQYSFRAVPVVS